MIDVLTPDERARNMAMIRSRNTKPELVLRRLLHAGGYRYRVHVRGLPGTPDIAFTARRKAIFVNGCFWHLHSCRWGQVRPATNSSFWEDKRQATAARDLLKREELEKLGWQSLTVWECELKNSSEVYETVRAFLGPPISPSG